MKKNPIIFTLLTAISSMALLTLSCSEKNEDNAPTSNPRYAQTNNLSPGNPNHVESIDEDNISSMEQDGVVMTYCLLNSKGDTTAVFAEGEEIIFDLKIENTTDQPIYFPEGPGFWGYDTFRVYTSEGEDCGISWTYIEDWTMEMKYFWPNTPKHYQCPWYSEEVIKPTYPFVFKPTAKRLKKGSYYTEAYSNFENEIKLYCKLNFKIE